MRKTLVVLGELAEPRVDKVLKDAEELGIRIVMCLTNQRDIKVAHYPDAVYPIELSDIDSILSICQKEHADGILGLTDPTVEPAAEVAKILGYRGNSPECVRDISYKSRFRLLQKKTGVFCPEAFCENDVNKAVSAVCHLHFPIILKPVLNSSSQGQTILQTYSEDTFRESFLKASRFSRNGEVCVEEYIENKSLKIIEIEAFLCEGKMIFEGARDSYRTTHDALRPIYDIYPANLTSAQMNEIHETSEKVIRASGATFGHYNIEGFFTQNGRFFIVEINPRQPGNCNCDHIELHSGVNMTKLLLTTALGDMSYFESLATFPRENRFILSHTLFSFVAGEIEYIHTDDFLKQHLCQCKLFTSETWPFVEDIGHAHYPIAKAAYLFDTLEETEWAGRHLDELVYPVIRK